MGSHHCRGSTEPERRALLLSGKRAAPLAAALAACAPGCRSAALPTPAPHLECKVTSHDFGQALEGDRLVTSFRIANTGAAPLRIGAIDPAYSCTGAAPPEPVAPGGSLDVTVSCPTGGREARMVDTLVVHTNDRETPSLHLVLTATLEARLAFESRTVDLAMDVGATDSKEVRLTGRFAKEARLALVTVDRAGPEVSIVPADSERPAGVRVTFASRSAGEGAGQVRLSTGLEDPPDLTLLYAWHVRSNLTVDPSNPFIDLRAPGPAEIAIRVVSRRAGIRLERAVVTTGPFAASVEKVPGGQGYDVLVRLDPNRVTEDPRGLLGTLRLLTNDPGEPARDVPLFALGPVRHGRDD